MSSFRLHRLAPVLLAVVLLVASSVPALASTAAAAASETIAGVAAKAKPSVVGILNTMKADRSTERGRGAGTGFVYKSGIIITNAHVVDKASELKILYPDKTVETVTPDKIFLDETSDIAVVKVSKKGLQPLPFANSDKVAVGQTVIAVGNPLGFRLGNSVSAGILSGAGRAIGSGYPFLQVDAAINPGNSGGPLFNLQGEVIGINSAKMAEIGVEGLAFAIPSNTARGIAEALLKDGKVERATLGIGLSEGWEAYFGVPDAEGVEIAHVVADGPSGLTALRSGDKLIKLDDTPVSTEDDVWSFLASKKPGDAVKVSVRRRGQVLTVRVVLGSKDELKQAAEEQVQEAGGILIALTAGQIQEAAEFGRNMSRGYADINSDYFGVSGSNYAILYTEYLYVARRISSAYEFGFQPGVGFQQQVAREIANKIEIEMEIHGDQAEFLSAASFTLEQNGVKKIGTLANRISYTTSADGTVHIGNVRVRFLTTNLNTTDDLTVTVSIDGKPVVFNFTIKELR